MFGWLKRKSHTVSGDDIIVTQPHGVVFPWPKGAILTAVDELMFALPKGIFDKDRPMSELVFGSDDMQINIPPDGDMFLVRLMPGMSISLAKSVQAYVISEDQRSRRIRVTRPAVEA